MVKVALSLFCNAGIAEFYLKECGMEVKVASDIDEKRVKCHKALYGDAETIVGDIKDPAVKDRIITESVKAGVRVVIATPPCQGMSGSNKNKSLQIREGMTEKEKNEIREKKEKIDDTNSLVKHAVEMIKRLRPDYSIIENVPDFLKTDIPDGGGRILVPAYIQRELGELYEFNLGPLTDEKLLDKRILNAKHYHVPQDRRRAIILASRKGLETWQFPEKCEDVVTLEDAIGNLPSLDPIVCTKGRKADMDKTLEMFPDFYRKLEKALKVSPYHVPTMHPVTQVEKFILTRPGKSVFDMGEDCIPYKYGGNDKRKKARVKGRKSSYKRQAWNMPAATVVTESASLSSSNNGHPGRRIGVDGQGRPTYSDARAFSFYEVIIVSSLPDTFQIPEGFSEKEMRKMVGEGIPPLMMKAIMGSMPELR